MSPVAHSIVQELGLTGTIVVTVSVRKTIQSGSNDVVFTFECDGNPCTNRTVALSHLSFDKTADFSDTTTVPVQGTISIAGTKEFNTAGNACPIELAKVCAINHYGANEQLVCSDTDINGKSLCAYIQQQLTRSFAVLVQASTHYLFLEDSMWSSK
jgi:hypothetical protein